jgi:hypothetical protein
LPAAAVALVTAVVGDADAMEPLERIRVGVADLVPADAFDEVVPIHADPSRPGDHVMIRRVVPGAAIALTPRRGVDRDGGMAHLKPLDARVRGADADSSTGCSPVIVIDR